jgi:uncharacterized Zn finger protein
VHYVLGEAFDKDPFLLFELRGRTKQQVLGALRVLRSGQSSDAQIEKMAADVADHAVRLTADSGVAVDSRLTEDYDVPLTALPTLQFKIVAPAVSGAVLKQLGLPPSWPDPPSDSAAPSFDSALSMLNKQLDAGSRLAREWALQMPDDLPCEPSSDKSCPQPVK